MIHVYDIINGALQGASSALTSLGTRGGSGRWPRGSDPFMSHRPADFDGGPAT